MAQKGGAALDGTSPLSDGPTMRQQSARLSARQTGFMYKRAVAVSASVAAGLAWLALLAFLAIPALSWWQDKAEQPPADAPVRSASVDGARKLNGFGVRRVNGWVSLGMPVRL